MKSIIACPHTDELRNLLDSSLSDERQQECMEHMESCSCCQSRLEGVATEGTNLSQVVRGLSESEPQATSAYWPALKAVETEVAQWVMTPPPRPKDVSLHFLQPASDTAYLGRLPLHACWAAAAGGGARGIRFAAASQCRSQVSIPSSWAMKLPISVSAVKRGQHVDHA